MLGEEINHVVLVYTWMYDVKCRKNSILQSAECIWQGSDHDILSLKLIPAPQMQYIFLKCSTHTQKTFQSSL